MKILKLISLLFCMLGLNACGMHQTSDCPGKPGINCKSIDEINQMVDVKAIPKKESCPKGGCKTKWQKHNHLAHSDINTSSESKTHPKREPEVVLSIWLAPFESERGVHHSESYLTTVVKPAKWVGK